MRMPIDIHIGIRIVIHMGIHIGIRIGIRIGIHCIDIGICIVIGIQLKHGVLLSGPFWWSID